MAWWQGSEKLAQGQNQIIKKAILDVQHTPQGATVWVQGCAGTGKTLVLAHIALELAAEREDRSIVFLTYTHALKEMINLTVTGGSVSVDVLTYKAYLYQKQKKRYEIILIDEIQDISKDEIPMYIKNMQQHKEEAFLWAPYVFGDRNYHKVAKVQDALLKMGAFLGDEYGMIGKRTLRALSQYQTAITNNQPVQFTYFNKNELLNVDYKTASEIDQILIGKDLDTYGFGYNTPGAEGFSKESIQKRLEMFKKLYSAQPQTTEELSPVQPNYNRTPTKYGKGRKNVNRNTKTTSEYKGFNNSLE